jgi:hypothetical protein
MEPEKAKERLHMAAHHILESQSGGNMGTVDKQGVVTTQELGKGVAH